ncbi:SNF2-related protein [Nakamurella sp.]|uniref:SNF2-related protein n=1 Tax=Nakamurella sp. TaxID=1869182 RepID=UPI0037839075
MNEVAVFVVHALWRPDPEGGPGRLALWAEDATIEVPRRRPGRAPKVRPHPFAAPHDRLIDALGPARGKSTTLAVRLPTRGGRPVDSPQLVRDRVDESSGPLSAGQWQVPVVEVDAGAVVDTLAALDPERAVLATSVTHLIELGRFAADLVGRGRLLPGVDLDPPRATWRPVLTGPDAAWSRALAQSRPASLAAADPDRPLTVWADALDSLVDAAARTAAGRMRLGTGRDGDPVTRAWLAALTGHERRFTATAADAAALAEGLAGWQADVLTGPVRACFRLVEPAETDRDQVFQVRLALQAADEPSLVVDAAQVWKARGPLPALARHLDSPQETLLAELGKARRVYPGLDAALRTARPAVLPLDTAAAHSFLQVAAPALATAGFGVQLPGWWTKPASRLGVRITASTPAQPGAVAGSGVAVGFAAITEFRHDLAVGGEVLTADELAELSAAKAPLVRLRGQWIELDARRLAAGLRVVGRTGTASVGELLRLGLGAGPDRSGSGLIEGLIEGLPVESVVADGWLGDLLSGDTELRLAPVDVPDSFAGRLRPYQARGLAWLDFLHRAGLGALLADDMGLGKTVQLLALLARDAAAGESGPSLLICPMSLVGNWQREAARFTPTLRVHVHHGAERARGKQFSDVVAAADLIVTTYSLAARDAADLRRIAWRRVVVDEAQAIKNAATRQATAIRSLPAGTRIAVTGTPVENRLADLWSIFEFVNPGMLGTATTFKQRYAEPIEKRGDDDAAARLRTFTQPFILRRVKTDRSIISDLPDKLEMDVLCNLTAEQAGLYRAVVDDMLQRIESSEGIERRGLVLATMTKLKQVCNHPAQFLRDGGAVAGRSGKLQRLDEILDEVLALGEKALLFTQYAEFGAMLRGHLTGRFGREVLFLHGGVAKPARDEMVARFQHEDPALFVLSLKAGGTGLTLTAANHVVHVDRWWNPAVEDQATDRAYRIGQRRAVQVRKFVCAGTIEEKIAGMIRDKRGLAARIVGSGEDWLTELSTGQLRELFALEAGAVVE